MNTKKKTFQVIHSLVKSCNRYLVTGGERTCPSGARRPSFADAYHWHPGILRQLVTESKNVDPGGTFIVSVATRQLPLWFICLNP